MKSEAFAQLRQSNDLLEEKVTDLMNKVSRNRIKLILKILRLILIFSKTDISKRGLFRKSRQ